MREKVGQFHSCFSQPLPFHETLCATTSGHAHLLGPVVGRTFLRMIFLCFVATAETSCRAQEASRCSADDVVETVKSLVGGSANPLAALLDPSYKIDAIRTVSSSANKTMCEARLATTLQMPVPSPSINKPAETETAAEQAAREKLRQPSTTTKDITYKVEKTDDGQTYITIIPSEAEILNEQNAKQQEQEQQYEFRQQDQQRERQYEYEEEERQRERGQ